MKKKNILLLIIAFFLFAAIGAYLDRPKELRRSDGWGPGTPYQRLYDPSKIEKLSGTLKDIQSIIPIKNMNTSASICASTSSRSIEHLLPQAVVALTVGDRGL